VSPLSSPAPRGEFDLIARIRERTPEAAHVLRGIGDDAAVLAPGAPVPTLVTVDLLMEGVDFTLPPATPRLVGRKALAVNLSDVAAMAGVPRSAVVALCLPKSWSEGAVLELHAGLAELAAEFDTAVVGGDTNAWDGPLVLSVTVLGECTSHGPVLRSGALPGDWILATGAFGGSIGGRHLTFMPRVREALAIHAAAGDALHAAIDVSDGLAADLHHLLEESGVGAIVDADAVPIHPDAVSASARDGRTPLEHALSDGEDFELLLAASPEAGRRLLANPPCAAPLTRIGEFVAGSGCLLRAADGSRSPLPPLGWVHPVGGTAAR
jgi:thiamine-monophosphate kinase